MTEHDCPFWCVFNVKCVYIVRQFMCDDISINPGNSDAWCHEKIQEAIDHGNFKQEAETPED